jgi:hypothetical protein
MFFILKIRCNNLETSSLYILNCRAFSLQHFLNFLSDLSPWGLHLSASPLPAVIMSAFFHRWAAAEKSPTPLLLLPRRAY